MGRPSGKKFQKDWDDRSFKSTRRIATVTIAASAAVRASFMISKVLYLPVPKIRRDLYVFPAMTKGASCILTSTNGLDDFNGVALFDWRAGILCPPDDL